MIKYYNVFYNVNMDHLFWRVSPAMEDHQFAWILWYIWKGRNNKVFSNLDIDPAILSSWRKQSRYFRLRRKLIIHRDLIRPDQ